MPTLSAILLSRRRSVCLTDCHSIHLLLPPTHPRADKEDMSAGWTVVFQTQIAFTGFGWAQFLIFYPSEGSALIR